MRVLRVALGALVLAPLLVTNIVIVFLPYHLLKAFGASKKAQAWADRHLVIMSYLFMWWLGVSVHVSGKEKLPESRRICYIANHQSLLDLPTIFMAVKRQPGVITKTEMRKVPIINWWCKVLQCVFIDRKSVRSSIKAILDGVKNVKAGRPMLIFPEGTRSKTGKPGEFKAGSFALATRSDATIVPISIYGTRAALETRTKWHVHAYVEILDPIDTSALDDEGKKQIHTLVQKRIDAAYDRLSKEHA